MKYLLLGLVFVTSGWAVSPAMAWEPITDCVIREFNSAITLNTDSSLSIVENISVDCGTLPDKHGIFRILPTSAWNRNKDEYKITEVSLVAITDENGNSRQYETIVDGMDGTIAWKIGDPDVLISGMHHYQIAYSVKNAVTLRDGKHQLYWNINGNFWELPVDRVTAEIFFPAGVTETTSEVSLYSGNFGEKDAGLAEAWWYTDPAEVERLRIESGRELAAGEGITVNVDFPTGIVDLYQPTFWEKYSFLIGIVSALFVLGWVFLSAYRRWRKLGQEFPQRHPVTAEFAPPDGMGPLEAEAFSRFGGANSNSLISATIVDLAVRGWLKIEEVSEQSTDWRLVLTKTTVEGLRDYEQKVLEGLFGDISGWVVGESSTTISSQRNKFYTVAAGVMSSVAKSFYDNDLFDRSSQKAQTNMIIKTVLAGFATFFAMWWSAWLAVVLAGTTIIYIVFSAIMSRRTRAGVEALRLIRGFKLYMSRAEKYRMQFYEKENIFEKYLGYAIAFGLTGKWVKAFREIYGEDKFNTLAPVWYVGAIGSGSFDAGSFEARLNSLSAQIGSTLTSSPSSSGSGGGGSSGGGGGGGGGGSW